MGKHTESGIPGNDKLSEKSAQNDKRMQHFKQVCLKLQSTIIT